MKKVHRLISIAIVLLCTVTSQLWANRILVPMDEVQKNHLKAYGVAYWVLSQGFEIDWLLNYRGGSFVFPAGNSIENRLIARNITYRVISEAQYQEIVDYISRPDVNMDVMKLEKAPRIAVYAPRTNQPWDDAVTLVLTYAEIPYDVIFDDEIMQDKLPQYDWLHLHHEDFTGQYGKFYAAYRNQPWYIQQQKEAESIARRYGFKKVSKLKLEVVKRIKAYIAGGGFMFAMCSATDTFDIALAAANTDICESMYDGDPADPQAQSKLDYSQCLAFQNFTLVMNPYQYEYSNIDNQSFERGVSEENDYFTLFQFSAKWDPIPSMLTQNHVHVIKGFMGQTTAFKKHLIKPDVVIMGENKAIGEARYIHGLHGLGFWTFYGGHDPEDYQHFVYEEPTDLSLYPNSPGYRLILNNVLFPAAKKKKKKT